MIKRTLLAIGVVAASAHAGPDVVVSEITDSWRWGAQGPITAYTIGTGACNIGDEPASWVANTNQHPVIVANIYRLKGGRFEQIGMSWSKHGFYSENRRSPTCAVCSNPTPGQILNAGCYDAYDSALNASQTLLGPRSEVNPYTGVFPFPFILGWQQSGGAINKRIQVLSTDSDPTLNPGALYFADAQYITVDEPVIARFNNATWTEMFIGADAGGGSYVMFNSSVDHVGDPGVFAWKFVDPGVTIRQVDVPGEGRLFVAYRVYPENDAYRYEYAVFNLNSDRGVGSFTIPIDDAVSVTTSFRDIAYHSGETISGVDWSATRGTGGAGVTWATDPFAVSPSANALRWHTLYNFTIVSANPPADVSASLGLWRPGSPASVSVTVAAPAPPAPPVCAADANGDNQVNGLDLSVFLSAFGTQTGDPGYTPTVDFNSDGIVNGPDLSVLLANFGCPN